MRVRTAAPAATTAVAGFSVMAVSVVSLMAMAARPALPAATTPGCSVVPSPSSSGSTTPGVPVGHFAPGTGTLASSVNPGGTGSAAPDPTICLSVKQPPPTGSTLAPGKTATYQILVWLVGPVSPSPSGSATPTAT